MRNSFFLPRGTLRARCTRRFLDYETRHAAINLNVIVLAKLRFYYIIRSVILKLVSYPSREKPE